MSRAGEGWRSAPPQLSIGEGGGQIRSHPLLDRPVHARPPVPPPQEEGETAAKNGSRGGTTAAWPGGMVPQNVDKVFGPAFWGVQVANQSVGQQGGWCGKRVSAQCP